MTEVKFKFNVDQIVLVKVFDDKAMTGVITMCSFDRSGVSYYVNMGENSAWWHEDQLKNYE